MTILVFCSNVSVQTRILFMKLTSIFQNAWKQIDKTQNFYVKICYSSLNNEYRREGLKHSKASQLYSKKGHFSIFSSKSPAAGRPLKMSVD